MASILPPKVPEGQEHLLAEWLILTENEKKELKESIESISLEQACRIFSTQVSHHHHHQLQQSKIDETSLTFSPPHLYDWTKDQNSEKQNIHCSLTRLADVPTPILQKWKNRGFQKIRDGKIGVVLMGGGAGTRLGFSGPKGRFKMGALSGKSFFQIFVERLIKIQNLAHHHHKENDFVSDGDDAETDQAGEHGGGVPLYIMTSSANHDETLSFFSENRNFGLKRESVIFFIQQEICSFSDPDQFCGNEENPQHSRKAKILLASPTQILKNPNGNGGFFGSLRNPGYLASWSNAEGRDVETISQYPSSPRDSPSIQCILDDMTCTRHLDGLQILSIDNLLNAIGDPTLIGFADCNNLDIANKAVQKSDGHEKIGIFVKERASKDDTNFVASVKEYSELLGSESEARADTGELLYNAGNIATHYISTTFIRNLNAKELPYHLARKKIPYYDPTLHSFVRPETPNGWKLELFIFDVFRFAQRCAAMEVDRSCSFAPVKNEKGCDSPESARRMMSALHKKWIEAAGGVFAGESDGDCEISSLVSWGGEGLENRVKTMPMPLTLPLLIN